MDIRSSIAALVPLALAAMIVAGPAACSRQPPTSDDVSRHGWRVTVYYTAVESYHRGPLVEVTGCPTADCTRGDEPLGHYPHGFVSAVHDEGTGRITSGPHAGKYLNWSHDVGYWLDSAPRDAHGRPLEPFRSAAADSLADGTKLRLVECGRGDPVPTSVCDRLRDGQWEIRDRFTPGLGGGRHIDLYVGEETEPAFTTSGELYVSLHGARFALHS